MKKIKIIVLVGILTLCASMNMATVFAEKVSQSLTVSPPTQRMILVPGESYTNSIRISNANTSTRALKYAVSVGSFSEKSGEESKDDYGVVDHISTSNYNQIMEWISLEKDSGSVEPNTTDILTYTINVPENAPAGGQYATIIIRDVTDSSDSNNGNVAIQSVYQFASIIYAEVAGETKESGKILENSVPTFMFSNPLTVGSMVENAGNVHTDAEYTLEIWPLFSGEEVYSNAEEPMTSLILPESKRYNTMSWEESPMFGIFKVKQTIKIYDDISTVEKVVILCPLWMMLIVVFIIVAIVVWLVARSKSRKNQ